jgi:hypothetical protein
MVGDSDFGETNGAGTPIEQLELTIRVYNRLRDAGITRVQELLKREPDELLEIPNFGRKSLTELISQLGARIDVLNPTERLLFTNRWKQTVSNISESRAASLLDQLIHKATTSGYLVTDDLLAAFPEAENNMGQLEEIFVQLINQGIEVYADIR